MYSLDQLFESCLQHKASDMYVTVGCAPGLRVPGGIRKAGEHALTHEDVLELIRACLTKEMMDEFEMSLEFNTSIAWGDRARFRLNIFKQQQKPGMVVRRIETVIPTAEELNLPSAYTQVIMENRGLVLVVGPTGSGKSTSLAAMVGHRNRNGHGHILTVEDPVEFLHRHDGCIVTQRDVGVDTLSFGLALKNALRQRPDVVVIGEIRDREAMEHALNFAETGHLCLATLHAGSAAQTIERIVTFFPEEKHRQVLQALSLNLRAIFCQRLVNDDQGRKIPATEILLNEGFMRTLIAEGHFKEMQELMEKNKDHGMHTLNQSLYELYKNGILTEEICVATASNPADMRLMIKQAQAQKHTRPVIARLKSSDGF